MRAGEHAPLVVEVGIDRAVNLRVALALRLVVRLVGRRLAASSAVRNRAACSRLASRCVDGSAFDSSRRSSICTARSVRGERVPSLK